MISWRYHVVSIVAVVLAFGLGILAGTSVVNDEFVEELQRNTEEAQAQRDLAEAELAIHEQAAVELQPYLRDGVLQGREAVVLTMEGVDRPARRATDELAAAGVDPLTTVELTRRLVEPDPDDLAALQEILGATSDDPNLLRHAQRAKEVGRNPSVVDYKDSFGPSASYYAWEAAGRPVHGIRK